MKHLELVNPWAMALLAAVLPVVLWSAWRTYDPMRRGRKLLVLLARVLVVLAAVIGLASVRWWRSEHEDKVCVVAMLDVSRSVPAGAIGEAESKIEELLAKVDDSHAAGLILFAGNARVAIPPGTAKPSTGAARRAIDAARAGADGKAASRPASSAAADLDLEATNVERALDLAMGVFPPGFGRRIVLFSDGNATDGDAVSKAARCRASGIDLNTVLLSHERAPFDVAVTSVSLPSGIVPGVGFDVTVRTAARAECDATLSLYRNGYMLEQRKLSLPAGAHNETFRQRLDEPGLYLYRATISSPRQQANLDNKAAFAFTRLRTVPKALVLGEADLEARQLMAALRDGGIVCEFRTADGAPEQLPDLLDFDAVILNNLRASSLNAPQQRLLRDYVEIFGGAMLVIGLDSVGGYAGTPVEDALPVVCGLDRLGKVSTSVVVIADTSRSLILADAEERQASGTTQPAGFVSRPDIIRRTAKQILGGLSERDYFGLIGFGSEMYAPRWVVRPQKVYDRAKIESAIEGHLLTTPRFDDPQALAELIQRMAAPASPVPPDQLARDIEALADQQHLPHIGAKAIMPYVRNKLKATKEAINPDELAAAVERLLEPNAFLARSNASRSILRAVSELKQRETARKSIIMLTDGYLEGGGKVDTTPEPVKSWDGPPKGAKEAPAKPKVFHDVEYDRLAGQLAADGITISTIALKEADANKNLLENISRWGQGGSYRLDDPAAFAEQFRKELEAVGKPRVMEFPFRARKVADSPLVRGVDVSVAPQLFGYVRTAPKLGARNILAAPPDYEPLLASWDFGAGRAAAFTADAQERWASLWIRDWSQGFNRLWSTVVHGLCERPADRRIVPQLDVAGQHVQLSVDFLDESSRFLNGQALKARFYWLGEEGYIFSRTAMEEVPMAQVAPGRYACEYRAPRRGIYIARVSGDGPRDVAAAGFVVSLLAEDTSLTADEAALGRWATAGGGEFADKGGSSLAWMSAATKTRETPVDVSMWAVVIGAIIFAIDVVLRRWPAFAQLPRGKAK
ncbi:MAG: glutamine amidotransferase [Phycisphaerae bacterium]